MPGIEDMSCVAEGACVAAPALAGAWPAWVAGLADRAGVFLTAVFFVAAGFAEAAFATAFLTAGFFAGGFGGGIAMPGIELMSWPGC